MKHSYSFSLPDADDKRHFDFLIKYCSPSDCWESWKKNENRAYTHRTLCDEFEWLNTVTCRENCHIYTFPIEFDVLVGNFLAKKIERRNSENIRFEWIRREKNRIKWRKVSSFQLIFKTRNSVCVFDSHLHRSPFAEILNRHVWNSIA